MAISLLLLISATPPALARQGGYRNLARSLAAIEAGQRNGTLTNRQVRSQLAGVGRVLRRHRSDRWDGLWSRFRAASAKTQLPRLVERQRSAGTFGTPRAGFRRGMLQAYASGSLTGAQVDRLLEPRFKQLPRTASRQGRQVLDLYYSKTVKLDDGAKSKLRAFLRTRGYDVDTYGSAGAARRGNITEADRFFERVSRQVGQRKTTIKMGVIDGGFDPDHVALGGRFWVNPSPTRGDVHGWSYTTKSGDLKKVPSYDPMSVVASGVAHGTHVAGIAGRGTKRIKMIGLAHSNIAYHAEAMTYAIDKGAKVVHFSQSIWGADKVSKVLQVIKNNPNVLFVQSAGNSGVDLNRYQPAAELSANDLPNFLRVSAAGKDLRPLKSTNFGKPFATLAAVAPTYSANTDKLFSDTGYVYAGKTSQAAPAVSNIAAKCMLLAPSLRPQEVKRLLVDTSGRSQPWKDKVVAGGLVNKRRAYRMAGLVGLVRGGMAPAAAADRVQLQGKERGRLLGLLPQYVPGT